jgi:hypothetical protein
MDDRYDFRGPSSVLGRFKRVAGKRGPSVCIKLLAWWLGIEGAELPERPCDAQEAA